MTPKEKAKELVDKFYNELDYIDCSRLSATAIPETARDCALIAVQELIEEQTMWQNGMSPEPPQYWQQVKQEIDKL